MEGLQRLAGSWWPLAPDQGAMSSCGHLMYSAVMTAQKVAGGLAGNPVFLLKQWWEPAGGCRWPPLQPEGGLRPEIEPGVGSPGQRQGWAWCWCSSQAAPSSGLRHGGRWV